MYGRATSDGQRRAVVERVLDAWHSNPDLRLGQLISNACHLWRQSDVFYIEDEALVAALDEFVKQ